MILLVSWKALRCYILIDNYLGLFSVIKLIDACEGENKTLEP